MADLEAWEGDYPETLFSHGYRRAQEGYPTTLAMHWDGTYRDRLRPVLAPAMYWEESAIAYMPSARSIAKHLA